MIVDHIYTFTSFDHIETTYAIAMSTSLNVDRVLINIIGALEERPPPRLQSINM